MSAFYGLTITCDDCDDPRAIVRFGNLAIGHEKAKELGWTSRFISGGISRWRCPACTAAQAKIDAFHEAEATKTA